MHVWWCDVRFSCWGASPKAACTVFCFCAKLFRIKAPDGHPHGLLVQLLERRDFQRQLMCLQSRCILLA